MDFNNHNTPVVARVSPIYILPSLFTLAAMFCGFYAIIQSIANNFISSGIAIFFAMILDSLDGRVARMTHTSSPFGAELDSLADMVSFGVAPAVITFNWGLYKYGKIGWLIAFIYCACAGLRLARFNTMAASQDKRYFIGIPSPAAAALVVGFIYICSVYKFHGAIYHVLNAIMTVVAAFTMVSNVKFYSFKELNFQHRGKFRVLLILLLIFALLLIYPDLVIYGFFVVYTITSYIIFLFRLKRKRSKLTIVKSDNNN